MSRILVDVARDGQCNMLNSMDVARDGQCLNNMDVAGDGQCFEEHGCGQGWALF